MTIYNGLPGESTHLKIRRKCLLYSMCPAPQSHTSHESEQQSHDENRPEIKDEFIRILTEMA